MKPIVNFLTVAGLLNFAPVFAATDLPLPRDVTARLEVAVAASDIADLAIAYPSLAGTIMTEAAFLGIASPSAVVSFGIAPQESCNELTDLVEAAAEAAPREADISARQAFLAAGGVTHTCTLVSTAKAAVDGIERTSLSAQAIDSEIAEIVAVLRGLAPGSEIVIGQAIAAATDRVDDTPQSVLAAADNGIETADAFGRARAERARAIGRAIRLRMLPSKARGNPSPN